MSLTKDQILTATREGSLPREKVETPDWGDPGHVFVRALAAKELTEAQKLFPKQEEGAAPTAEVFAAWCVLCVCDIAGKRLFDDDSIPQLLQGPCGPLMKCAEVGMRLSGMDKATQEETAGN